MIEQFRFAEETKAFLKQFGLKQKFVAGKCNIDISIFSRFLNHQIALSKVQMPKLQAFVSDYTKRMM